MDVLEWIEGKDCVGRMGVVVDVKYRHVTRHREKKATAKYTLNFPRTDVM